MATVLGMRYQRYANMQILMTRWLTSYSMHQYAQVDIQKLDGFFDLFYFSHGLYISFEVYHGFFNLIEVY
jgi:hypothetical protein